MKRTAIIGATPNPSRYAYIAAHSLKEKGYDFVPIGIKNGEVAGQKIVDMRNKPQVENIDTLTLYLGAKNQEEWQDYMLSLKPKRIIFNPGTENPEFEAKAKSEGIETLNACTLVMLNVGNY